MKFTKMHGIGNDYIYVDLFHETVKDPAAAAIALSERHFGIGGDGMILIAPSEIADVRMIMYNADGSQGEMCGNGIRCVGKLAYELGLSKKNPMRVETLGGIRSLDLHVNNNIVESVTVDMGIPEFHPERIGVNLTGERVVSYPLAVGGKTWDITAVSMGNPHAVTFVNNVDELELTVIGPDFEYHPLFPNRINTEFVQVIDRKHVRMRVWERGSGETLACGTGACAVLAACVTLGLTDETIEVSLSGGPLQIYWDHDTGHIYMTGPAEIVFRGETINDY